MKNRLLREESDAILLHFLFALLCVSVLLIPNMRIGVKLFILVAAYNVAVPLAGTLRGHASWRDIWLFSLVVSIFQVFPDWFLSDVLGVLVFPEDGFPKIGTVSGYMAGLWTIPVFIIVYAGTRVRERHSPGAGYLAAALLALAIFVGSEATVWMLPSWYARDVLMAGHVAVYIIIPEIILGIACLYAYVTRRGSGLPAKTFAAFIVMQLYLGSAVFFYFLIERVIR
ncbi:MAG: hypothetical protein JW838_03415 [Spirochaetes bacterium]|nr:hypothetical protein [Spirochaetota bacterium]